MSIILKSNLLGKVYGSTRALSGVNFELEAGPPIAMIGPNGAGKTTLLSIVCGFIRASEGEVQVLGYQPGSRQLHSKLAALPQDAQLDPRFSIGHQLVLYARLQGCSSKQAVKECRRVLEQVGLSDTIDMKPTELSHGMRKRVLFAQTLLGEPKLILLDEPTAGLDPPNVKVMRNLISDTVSKATFIISSHNLDELEKVCRSVVCLEGGLLKSVSQIDQSSRSGYLTLVMADNLKDIAGIETVLRTINGIHNVVFSSPNRFVIDYDAENFPNIELQILQKMAENGWQYRQIINGKTLEDQLYAS